MKPRILLSALLLGLSWPVFVVAQNASPPATGKGSATAARRNLTIADYFELQDVDDPQLSPEGGWVAYTITRRDLKEDKSEEQIWMVPTAGGAAIPLTAKDASSSHPRWSPDQKFLAFLSARGEEKKQVWTLYRGGGEAQQLTDTPQDVHDFVWSPQGDKMALVLQDPTPEELAAKEKKESDKSNPKTPPPWVIDRLYFKVDEVGYLDRRRTHLYVFDLATKKMIQVTSGDYDDTGPAWSPDARFLAFTSNRTENPDANYNTDIWVVAADNTDKGKTLRKLTSNPGADHSPAWSPDGKWVACVSQIDVKALDYATQHLVIVPAAGGPEKVLTLELDRSVIAPRFSADGQWIYFLMEDEGTQPLARIPAKGGEVERPIAGTRSVQAYSLGKDARVAALISEPHLPEEIFLLMGGNLRRLTTTNDALMAQVRLGDVEYIHFKSKDGTPVSGYLFKPPDYKPGTRYPAILWIHGGPVMQYDPEFDFRSQLLAANGYVVLNANPRGSSGYGQKFSQAIFADWGNKDYEDVIAAVDYAIAQGIADPERLGVGGWSYGGILTNNVITKTTRFRGAISGASEFLYISNWGHDEYVKDWELELGLPWKNRALWERLSPFNYVEKVTTPTLVMGGDQDWNVPINNSEQLYLSLKQLGVPTLLVVYPGEFHEFAKPSYLKDRFERYLAWYAQYVKGEPPQAPQSKTAN